MVNPPGGQLGYDSRGGQMGFDSPPRQARSLAGESLAGSPYSGRTAPLTVSPAGVQQMGARDGGQGSPSQGFGMCCGREEPGTRPPPWDPNKLAYVGERRGTYRRVVQYEYVGDGQGDFDMPIEGVPESSSCSSTCCCCCFFALCVLAAGIGACWRYEWPVPISQVVPAIEALGRWGPGGDADAVLVDCAANGTAPRETAACCNRTAGQGQGCRESATSSTTMADSSLNSSSLNSSTTKEVDAADYCKDIDSFSDQPDMQAWCCENAAMGCTEPNVTVSSSIGAAKSAAASATQWVSGSNGTQPGLGNASLKAAGVVDAEAPAINSSWGTVWTDADDQVTTGDSATISRRKKTLKVTTTTPRPTETSPLTTTTEDQTAKCYKKGEWSLETQKICCEALSIGCSFSEEASAGGGRKSKKRHDSHK